MGERPIRRIDGAIVGSSLHVRRRAVAGIAGALGAVGLLMVSPAPAGAVTNPFSALASGYTQALYGTGLEQEGAGVAFASNGDPLTSEVGGPLTRFSSTSTTTMNGSVIHTATAHPNTALGLGVATSTNSALYDNTGSGVLQVDPSTGATLAGPGATSTVLGNEHSIAADPMTGRLVFADGNNGDLSSVTEDLSSLSTFSNSLETGINYDQGGDAWRGTRAAITFSSPGP